MQRAAAEPFNMIKFLDICRLSRKDTESYLGLTAGRSLTLSAVDSDDKAIYLYGIVCRFTPVVYRPGVL